MDTSLASNISDMIWLPTIFVLLGAASGTYLLRRLRLPPFFWLPLVLGSTCLLSYALFYVYFFSPSAGRSASWWAVVISAALFAWQCRRLEVRRLLADRECWLPGFLATLVFAG